MKLVKKLVFRCDNKESQFMEGGDSRVVVRVGQSLLGIFCLFQGDVGRLKYCRRRVICYMKGTYGSRERIDGVYFGQEEFLQNSREEVGGIVMLLSVI